MDRVLEVVDLIGNDSRRLIIVAFEAGLRQRPDNSATLVINVFAYINVSLLILGWPRYD